MSMKPSEHNEQATLFDYLLLKLREHPEIHPLFFAVANGSHLAGNATQRARQMNKLKKEGFTPGVADTTFLSGRGGYMGMVLEMKTAERRSEKDGGLSDSQLEFLRAAKIEGYMSTVAYGAEDAISIVSSYLAMNKTQDMIYRALRFAENGDAEACKKVLQDIVKVW